MTDNTVNTTCTVLLLILHVLSNKPHFIYQVIWSQTFRSFYNFFSAYTHNINIHADKRQESEFQILQYTSPPDKSR
jgi:hypothetical protein